MGCLTDVASCLQQADGCLREGVGWVQKEGRLVGGSLPKVGAEISVARNPL